MTDLPALAAALRAALGPRIGVGVANPQTTRPALHAQEIAATARMTGTRRREFTAGRSAARAAMAALGLPACPVPMDPDRAPRWPKGLCGSISHTRTAAVALVSREADAPGLGVDIEEDTPLEADLWNTVLTATEQAWLAGFSAPDQGRIAKAVFSAKEALYKAQYPLTGQMLTFHDVQLAPARNGFTVLQLQTSAALDAGAILSQRIAGLVASFASVKRQ